MAGLSLPRQLTKQAKANDLEEVESSTGPLLVNARASSPWTFNQLMPFFARLAKDSPKSGNLNVFFGGGFFKKSKKPEANNVESARFLSGKDKSFSS